MKKRVLAIGHSHLGALEFFLRSKQEFSEFELEIVQLLSSEYADIEQDSDGRTARTLRQKDENCDLVVLAISGNEHQMMGLVNHPRPFDFVLPERPDLPLQKDREIVPFELIRDTLESWMKPDLFRKMSELLTRPMFQLEPPPPVLDEEHIRNHAGIFREKIDKFGVNHPAIRFKLWRVSSNLIASYCAKFGIEFLPVPAEAVGPEGFLHYMALCPDPTHANGWYGALVVHQLRELLDRRKNA